MVLIRVMEYWSWHKASLVQKADITTRFTNLEVSFTAQCIDVAAVAQVPVTLRRRILRTFVGGVGTFNLSR